MKHEYHEGKEALARFEQGAAKLFQTPKVGMKKATPKPSAKPKKTSKD